MKNRDILIKVFLVFLTALLTIVFTTVLKKQENRIKYFDLDFSQRVIFKDNSLLNMDVNLILNGKPVRIPRQTEFLKVQPLVNDCHRNTADNFTYVYYEILLHADGTAGIASTIL